MVEDRFTLMNQIGDREGDPASPRRVSLYELGNRDLWFVVFETVYADLVLDGGDIKPVLFHYLNEVKVIDPLEKSRESRRPKKIGEFDLVEKLVAHIKADCEKDGIVFRDDRDGFKRRKYLEKSYYCRLDGTCAPQ